MRPYLVLMAVVLMAVAAFGATALSSPGRLLLLRMRPLCPAGDHTEISLQTISPNPVGASNATTGLIAGATNSTLSEIQGSTSSDVHRGSVVPGRRRSDHDTASPPVARIVGREGHAMHEGMREEHPREEHGPQAEARGWIYYPGREHTASAVRAAGEAKGLRKAGHVYTNDDVTRQNDKNGTVKYNGKTEKM